MWLQACPIYLHVYLGSLYILKPPVIITSYGKLGIHIGSLHAHTHVTEIHIYAWEILPKSCCRPLAMFDRDHLQLTGVYKHYLLLRLTTYHFPLLEFIVFILHGSLFRRFSAVLIRWDTERPIWFIFWYMDSMSNFLFEGYNFIVYLIQQLAQVSYRSIGM